MYSKAGILYFLLDAELTVLSCNVTAEERLRRAGKILRGKNFLSFVEDSRRQGLEVVLVDGLRRGYVKDRESVLSVEGGRSLAVRLNGLVETDDEGNPDRFRLTAQDISESVRTRKEKDLVVALAGTARKGPMRTRVEEMLALIRDSMGNPDMGLILDEGEEGGTVFRPSNASESIGTEEDFWEWTAADWMVLSNVCAHCDTVTRRDTGSVLVSSVSDLLVEIASRDGKDRLISLAEYESLLLLPVRDEAGDSGVFVMMHEDAHSWDSDDVALLESLIPMVVSMFHAESEPQVSPMSILERMRSVPLLGVILVMKDRVTHVNPWIERFLGVTQEEIQGRGILEFFEPESHDVVRRLRDYPGLGADAPSSEILVLDGEGRSKRVECSIMNASTNGEGAEVWFWVDVENRRRMKQQLLQARKMESLGLLAGGIVHEFNNLLASVLGYSSLLSEEVPKDSPFYDDIQQINATSEKATELTSRLMAYAQGGAYVVEDLDVNQIVKEVAGILSRTLEKNISIRADLDPDLVGVKADASQIQQAIFQVALNSRDAMPHGGKLIFQTRNITLDAGDARSRFGGKPGPYIQVIISDTGDGMSREIKESIFTPYFTTKDKTAGKGLGLSMVHDIVEQHGGFLSVFSEKAKGTVFKMHLPAVAGRDVVFDVEGEKPLLGKETILLVDSESVLRETARKMLTRYGYKVISTDNGTEAIGIYKKYRERIDLVVLDLGVSGAPVKKLLDWFHKLNPRVKILATSDNGDLKRAEEVLKTRVVGTIQKPYQVRPLLKKLRSVLNPTFLSS